MRFLQINQHSIEFDDIKNKKCIHCGTILVGGLSNYLFDHGKKVWECMHINLSCTCYGKPNGR